MITVIHLRDSGFVGGPEKQILGQVSRLDRSRFAPVVVSFAAAGKDALAKAAAAEGVAVGCLPDGKLTVSRAVSGLRALLRRSLNPVVIASGFKADLTARWACGADRVPWIAWFHGYTGASARVRCYEALDKRALKDARRVVAVCERTGEHLRASGLANVTVVHNGIDTAAVRTLGDRRSARLELGIRDNEFCIGVASRLSMEKGIDLFISSASGVLRVHPNARFAVVGDGPERAALQRQAARLRIADRFVFTGMRQDAVHLMKGFDVFVLPSLRENMPVALLEAMACGISVVATDVGGVREVLDTTPAEPVAAGCSLALTLGMVELLDDQALRRVQSSALMKRVDDFRFDRQVRKMESVLEQVVVD